MTCAHRRFMVGAVAVSLTVCAGNEDDVSSGADLQRWTATKIFILLVIFVFAGFETVVSTFAWGMLIVHGPTAGAHPPILLIGLVIHLPLAIGGWTLFVMLLRYWIRLRRGYFDAQAQLPTQSAP